MAALHLTEICVRRRLRAQAESEKQIPDYTGLTPSLPDQALRVGLSISAAKITRREPSAAQMARSLSSRILSRKASDEVRAARLKIHERIIQSRKTPSASDKTDRLKEADTQAKAKAARPTVAKKKTPEGSLAKRQVRRVEPKNLRGAQKKAASISVAAPSDTRQDTALSVKDPAAVAGLVVLSAVQATTSAIARASIDHTASTTPASVAVLETPGNGITLADLAIPLTSSSTDPGAAAGLAPSATLAAPPAAAVSFFRELTITTPRAVVLTDMHANDYQCQIALGQANAYDENTTIIILGDCNDKGPDTEKVFDRLQRLYDLKRIQKHPEQFVYLCGNHELLLLEKNYDLAYGFNSLGKRVEYDREKIRNQLIGYVKNDILKAAWTDGINVFSHAGINLNLLIQFENDLKIKYPGRTAFSKQELVDHINEIFKKGVMTGDFSHPIFKGSNARGDVTVDPTTPGLFWQDFSAEFSQLRPDTLAEQIVGHSVSLGDVKIIQTPSSGAVCLDTGMAAGRGSYMELNYTKSSATRDVYTRQIDGSWKELSLPATTV